MTDFCYYKLTSANSGRARVRSAEQVTRRMPAKGVINQHSSLIHKNETAPTPILFKICMWLYYGQISRRFTFLLHKSYGFGDKALSVYHIFGILHWYPLIFHKWHYYKFLMQRNYFNIIVKHSNIILKSYIVNYRNHKTAFKHNTIKINVLLNIKFLLGICV